MPHQRLNFEQWRTLVQESPEQVADNFFERIKAIPKIEQRAWFASLPEREALIKALKVSCRDAFLPLASVPYVLQDMFDIQDMPTACGAPFTAPFEAPMEQSSLLYQTLDAFGACFFNKTVPAEFGVGIAGRNPTYGNCNHADGPQFICGGGAGASVRSVAEGLTPLGFGLDTGGGIRVPAAFHGLFGFRMGNNAYARDGAFPIAPSIESVGWVNNCLADLRTTFHAFHRVSKFQQSEIPRGYLISELSEPIAPEVKSGLLGLTRQLDIEEDPAVGTTLRKALALGGEAYRTLESRELYSIHKYLIEENSEQYDEILLRSIQAGRDCKPAKAEDSTHIQENIRSTLTEFFRSYDYLVLPISPIASPERSDWSYELEQDIQQLVAPASLAFLPAIILPFGCTDNKHSAAQVIINPRKIGIVPALLTQLAKYYEK